MATGVVYWSLTPSVNASSDSGVNWQEGQAPSSVNDSARGLMSSVARWRNDITGIAVTGGTSTAYTISSTQGITTNLDGFTIQFTPSISNGGPTTLSVDGQTAAPVRFRNGQDIPGGVLISGSLYQVTYRAASGEWLLHSFDSSIYNIPIGAALEYYGLAAPNGAFAIPVGQAISRSIYSVLFNRIGTAYGAGDGSSTFNLPDLVGRIPVMRDPGGARITGNTFSSTDLGGVGGAERNTLDITNMAPYTPTGSVPSVSVSSSAQFTNFAGNVNVAAGGNPIPITGGNSTVNSTGSGTFVGNANGGVSAPFTNIQPSIICNRIMRVI